MIPTHFLSDQTRLGGDDAAAAIIMTADGRYLLQLRDDIPGIFYPGHWGCFGGAVSPGETAAQTLARELEEELTFRPGELIDFVCFDFDLSALGGRTVFRKYFVVPITEDEFARCELHEGCDLRLFAPDEIFGMSNITPYDSFAIWLHVARARFESPRK